MIAATDIQMFNINFIVASFLSGAEIVADGMDRETQFPEIADNADSHAWGSRSSAICDPLLSRIVGNHFGYKVY